NRSLRRHVWSVDFDGHRIYELAWAGDHLFLGDRGRALVHDAETGDRLAEYPIEGQACVLAVADGRLIVSIERGELICFHHKAPSTPVVHDERQGRGRTATTGWPTAFTSLKAALDLGTTPGFALVDGLTDTALSETLAELVGKRVIHL